MAKDAPKVSVVVCCYNGGDYLPRCLDALLAQTFGEIEIICINDASTDNTAEVLSQYAKKDMRIVVKNNEQNRGLASSRNVGIETAKSELIMFCDADDWYEPTTCEQMYKAMAKSGADMAVCEIAVTYEAHQERQFDDSNYYTLKFSGLQKINDDIVENTDVSSDNKIFRKTILNQYQIRFPDGLRYEDFYFFGAYTAVAKTIYYVNEQLYNYVRHEDSIMANTWSKKVAKDTAIDHLYVGFRLYDFLVKHDLLKIYNQRFWKLFSFCCIFAVSECKTSERRKQTRQEALEFIQEHRDSFDKIEPALQERIMEINAIGLKRISPAKIKRKAMRLFPVYNLQTKNIERLRSLQKEVRRTAERIGD